MGEVVVLSFKGHDGGGVDREVEILGERTLKVVCVGGILETIVVGRLLWHAQRRRPGWCGVV